MMREGWKRCKADFVATSPDPDFYEHDTKARSLYVSFLAIPDLIRRFTLFGDEIKLEGELKNKKVKLEATNRKIDLYLPSTIRWSLEEINSGNQ